MEYVLITLMTISFSTLMVYFFANHVFKIAIRLKPLLICAACAILISVVLPRLAVGMVGLAGTFGILLVCAVIFAYLIAYHCDKPATDSDECEVTSGKIIVDEPLVQPLAKDVEPSQRQELPKCESIAEIPETFPEKEVEVAVQMPEPFVAVDESVAFEEVSFALEDVAEMALEASDLKRKSDQKEETIESEPELEPVKDECRTTEDDRVDLRLQSEARNIVVEQYDDGEVELRTDKEVNVTLEAAAETGASVDVELSLELEDVITPEEREAASQLPVEPGDDIGRDGEIVQADNAQWETLDLEMLWDMALTHKEEKAFALALGCFRAILRRFPESDLVSLVAIEAANLLKNDGLYDEAINLFSEARTLPAIREDAPMEQEFIVAIAYLRIVKNILVQNRLGFMPFRNIPEEILHEIDSEFKEWRKLA
ncbi:hypothetical protein [Azotosporobacter soli]|uniref:hypothetical protein n=1 Tax=Azotosporobacter soli TaxID=3055040 RepID=UPI0031FE8A54